MALYGMADNNIAIPAKRDGAIYNAFARNSDFVVEGIGDEFAMTSSTTSFVLTLGTGEGIICGRHVTEVTEDNVNSVLQLEANSQGYIVIRMDLTRPSGSECYLTAVSTVTREDLNDTGTIADLVLYGYVTGSNGVTSFVDMRNIRNASAVAASEVTYSNTSSGLVATNVQAAVDEVDNRLDGALDFLSGLKLATMVTTPNSSGEITIPFSDVGLTQRPNVVIVTGGNDSARVYTYLFDRSTSEIILNVYKNGSPVTGACRINILIYPYNKV